MSRIRGQEVTIRITVDGRPQEGTWLKVKDFTVTNRTDIIEENYIGELQTDLDEMHHGFDLSFSVDMQDAEIVKFLRDSVSRQESQDGLPTVTINVLYSFRDGSNPIGETYFDTIMVVSEQSFGGRTEYVSYSIDAKAKRRAVLDL